MGFAKTRSFTTSVDAGSSSLEAALHDPSVKGIVIFRDSFAFDVGTVLALVTDFVLTGKTMHR